MDRPPCYLNPHLIDLSAANENDSNDPVVAAAREVCAGCGFAVACEAEFRSMNYVQRQSSRQMWAGQAPWELLKSRKIDPIARAATDRNVKEVLQAQGEPVSAADIGLALGVPTRTVVSSLDRLATAGIARKDVLVVRNSANVRLWVSV